MSIRPVALQDNQIRVRHDDIGYAHDGTLALDAIGFLTPEGRPPDLRFLRLPCPVCQAAGVDSFSVHPVSGGADGEGQVQRLFAHKLKAAAPGRTWAQARTLVKALVGQQDGAARFRLDGVGEGE